MTHDIYREWEICQAKGIQESIRLEAGPVNRKVYPITVWFAHCVTVKFVSVFFLKVPLELI